MSGIPQSSRFADNWISNLRRFIGEIQASQVLIHEAEIDINPALTGEALFLALRPLEVEVPPEIREFVTAGASRVHFSFRLQKDEGSDCIWGGIEFDINSLPRLIQEKQEWTEETWVSEDEEERSKWEVTFPFCRLANGDYLGLVSEGKTSGCVMYLSHDSESQVIAGSFSSFLQEWAKCCYIGPEFWMIEDFLSAHTGYLDGETDAARTARGGVLSVGEPSD